MQGACLRRRGAVPPAGWPTCERAIWRHRLSSKGFEPSPAVTPHPSTHLRAGPRSTPSSSRFELDLWGRLRRATEAARAELLATEDGRRTVVLTLVSDVAQGYFDLLELDLERAIARRTLESRRESLRIVTLRQQEGLTSELDVRRAEGEVASAAAQVPDLERRVAQTEHRLSLLLGRNPGPIPRGAGLVDQVVAGVTLPIFNAGRDRARLGAGEACREQALVQYEQAIQQAFREVEDALVAHRKAREVRTEQEALVAASRRALELAALFATGAASPPTSTC